METTTSTFQHPSYRRLDKRNVRSIRDGDEKHYESRGKQLERNSPEFSGRYYNNNRQQNNHNPVKDNRSRFNAMKDKYYTNNASSVHMSKILDGREAGFRGRSKDVNGNGEKRGSCYSVKMTGYPDNVYRWDEHRACHETNQAANKYKHSDFLTEESAVGCSNRYL